ncbi:unnamed protein product, partial [Linum tenue]
RRRVFPSPDPRHISIGRRFIFRSIFPRRKIHLHRSAIRFQIYLSSAVARCLSNPLHTVTNHLPSTFITLISWWSLRRCCGKRNPEPQLQAAISSLAM